MDQAVQDAAQPQDHLGSGFDSVRRAHQEIERAKPRLLEAKGFANAALDPVSIGRPGRMFFCHQQSEPCVAAFPLHPVERVAADAAPLSLAQQALELRFLPQAPGRVEPEALAGRGYSPRRRRPRARRLRSTARPPRVPLRTRKPWRRARRVFEGWYVRLVAIAPSEKGRY